MPDALTMLAIVAATVTAVSFLLARLIPDEYDGTARAPNKVPHATHR